MTGNLHTMLPFGRLQYSSTPISLARSQPSQSQPSASGCTRGETKELAIESGDSQTQRRRRTGALRPTLTGYQRTEGVDREALTPHTDRGLGHLEE
jgi:hypothetical protein